MERKKWKKKNINYFYLFIIQVRGREGQFFNFFLLTFVNMQFLVSGKLGSV